MLWQLDPRRKVFCLSVHAPRQIGCLGDARERNTLQDPWPGTDAIDGGSNGFSRASARQRREEAACGRVAATCRARSLRSEISPVRAVYVRDVGRSFNLLQRRTVGDLYKYP